VAQNNGLINAPEISQLANMASKVKNGGDFILAACDVGIGNEGEKFARSLRQLTGSRMNIYLPKDFVNIRLDPSGSGRRLVDKILRISHNAGWLSISPSGALRDFSTLRLSKDNYKPVTVQ